MLSCTALVLLLSGCPGLYLSNPLPPSTDNRVIGKWSQNGKVIMLVSAEPDGSYTYYEPNNYGHPEKGLKFYLARVGDMLFYETPTECTKHLFAAPSPADSPNGCWLISRVALTDNTLTIIDFDTVTIVRQSLDGKLKGINRSYGGSGSQGNGDLPEMLLEGTSAELKTFLESYSRGAIYGKQEAYTRSN